MSSQLEPPRRNISLSPAIDSIAVGAATAGRALGLRSRGENQRPELEAEPTPAPPDLGLLLFVDSADRRLRQYVGHTWESVQPPSFAEWAYRCTPRNPRHKGRTTSSGEVSISSTAGPSTDLTTISEATRAHFRSLKCKQGATATPSTTAGSTRVPSRSSPEELAPNALPRPPSKQRPKAGPRRPRSSMGIPDVKSSSNTNPKRPQTSMGIFHSSSSNSHPPDATQSRPRSSLGFSPGGNSDAITTPPRPKSSIGMCPDEHHSTDSVNGCGSTCEEASSEQARTPSPNTGSCGVESSGLVAAQSRSEQLNAAAEEAGAKARGEVTLAIRARTICRLAGNAASRKLLHLWGDWDCPPESILAGAEDTKSKDKVEKVGSEDVSDVESGKLKPPDGLASTAGAGRYNLSPLGSIFEEATPRKRSIKVAGNTALGRMVREDPDRAAKYDLVTIPAWQLNKPWPPPPIGARDMIRQAAEHSRAKAFEMEAEKVLRMERAESRRLLMKKRVTKLQVITSLVGLSVQLRKSRESHSTLTEESEPGSEILQPAKGIIGYDSEVADLESAGKILDWSQKEAYRAIFNRFSKHDDYKLTRRGMIKAMREAGLTPTSTEEQRRFSAVQEQVIESTRGEFDEHPENNPLTSPQGRWVLPEFLLVCASLREINLRKLRVANQNAADEFDVPLAEVEELRKVFHQYDPDNLGTITAQDLKELLLVVDVKTSDEDFLLLLQSAGLHKELFEFQEFLKLLKSLETVMKSPAKVVGPSFLRKRPGSPSKSPKNNVSMQMQTAPSVKSSVSMPLQPSPGALTPGNRSTTNAF